MSGGAAADPPAAVAAVHPVSHGQRALWLLHRRDPRGAGAAYTIAAAGRIRPPVDPVAVRGAFETLLRRHQALRAVFPADPATGEPVQRVRTAERAVADPAFFEQLDAGSWAEEEVPERLADLAYRPFDLERGPLLRVVLARRPGRSPEAGAGAGAEAEWIVLLAMHHLAGDLWSLAVMMRELGAAYTALVEGKEPEARLDPPELVYGEWVQRRREALAGEEGVRLWRFWRQRFDPELGGGAPPPLDLPVDHPRPPVQTFAGETVARSLSPGRSGADGGGGGAPFSPSRGRRGSGGRGGDPLKRDVGRLARRHGTNRFTVLMAAFQAVLGRWSGQSSFLVGSPTSGRTRGGGLGSELAGAVGYFVNPVAIRAPLEGDPTFSELLGRLAQETATALDHQDLPFPLLAERHTSQWAPERDPSRPALFQTLLVLQKSPVRGTRGLGAFALGRAGRPLELGRLELESVPMPQRGAQFELSLFVTEESGELVGSLEYNSDLFERSTAERLLGHLATLLAGALEEPGRRLPELPLMSPAERRQVVEEWSVGGAGRLAQGVGTPAEPALLHERFAARAAEIPGAAALLFDAGEEIGSLTYGELDRRSAAVARALAARGVGPEVPVGVFLERTPELLVAILGVLRSGGAYVPLDPGYPEERLSMVAEDSRMPAVVTSGELADCLPAGVETLRVETLEEEPGEAVPAAGLVPAPESLAYVIYTSGSTGRPKGVAITHASACSLLDWAAEAFDDDETEGVLAATSVCFDLSVFELFAPLARGGRVILARDALALSSHPARGEVTLVNTVPSAMEGLCRAGALPPAVRTVCLAGEPLRRSLVDAVYEAGSAGGDGGVERVLNLYGPSEDTTYSTEASCPPGVESEPTIGRVLRGSRAHVVDRGLHPLPCGVPGELVLGGPGLARGYLGRPGLTAESFVPDPFEAGTGGGVRLYRTGDLARWLPDGELELLGRLDHQVKVRGFRIELDEVEIALAAHPAVQEVVVVARGEGGERRLAAYAAPAADLPPAGELRSFLGRRLPGYMVPDLIVPLDALPRTPNGKVDRRALPEPAAGRGGVEREYVAPETEVERMLIEMWREVLGVERVGVHDSFFELGGHSLTAHRVLVRVRETFGVEVAVHRLFEEPTVAGLQGAIAEALVEGADEAELAELLGD